jgi:hypothetical protein
MTQAQQLRKRLEACPDGIDGWKEFEDVALAILEFLFVPPLTKPLVQPRTYSEIDRRDAVFPNRNFDASDNWGRLFKELEARMLLIEFKNYDHQEIGKEEVNQTRNYLTKAMGRLAIICCNRMPNDAAHIKRNTIYNEDGKVILFMTKAHLIEMLFIKERGEEPSDLIMDLVERFYLQHE